MARKQRTPEQDARAEFIELLPQYQTIVRELEQFPVALTKNQFYEWRTLVRNRDSVDQDLCRLASIAHVRKNHQTVFFLRSINVSLFTMHGKFARRYAEAMATMIQHRCFSRCYARVVEMRNSFDVHVGVETEIDVEIVRRLPEPPLREWVKRCWAFGADPRIFNPFLPVGLETTLGIDYGGRDVTR